MASDLLSHRLLNFRESRGLTQTDMAARVDRQHRSDSVGTVTTPDGLSPNDVLSQVRADIAMIEGGAQSEKRRAYHFLREVHLPMLARMLKLD